MMMFIFSVLDQKYPSWKNLSKMIKVVANFYLSYLTGFCQVFALANYFKCLKTLLSCSEIRVYNEN